MSNAKKTRGRTKGETMDIVELRGRLFRMSKANLKAYCLHAAMGRKEEISSFGNEVIPVSPNINVDKFTGREFLELIAKLHGIDSMRGATSSDASGNGSGEAVTVPVGWDKVEGGFASGQE